MAVFHEKSAGVARERKTRGAILLTWILAAVAFAAPAYADTPATLVKNINADDAPCNSLANFGFTAVEAGSFAYFTSDCSGGQLWRIDAAGALLLASFDSIGETALVGGRLLFSAGDATNGVELWSSDGTALGTTLLADINPGAASSTPYRFVAFGGQAFFVADDGTNGYELWITDGTPGGTSMVLDIAPGATSSTPFKFFSTNGVALFSAIIAGTERLWRSDGTAAGTFEISSTAAAYQDPVDYADLGTVAVFTGLEAATGAEPWVTDGTIAGTFQLADVVPGPVVSDPGGFTAIGGKAVFGVSAPTSGRELWATDGTIGGTGLIADISPGTTDSYPGGFTALGGLLYFSAADPTNGRELWRTDGTSGGTSLVGDLNPGASGSNPANFVESGGLLYFTAWTAAEGYELWRTDGTGPGTFLIEDIRPGPTESVVTGPALLPPVQLTALGGLAYFVANDGVHGYEVWRSDGTAPGTFMPLDVTSASSIVLPRIGARIGGELFYLAVHSSGTGSTVWRTDGATPGTVAVAERPTTPSSDPQGFADLGGIAYFSAFTQAAGRELWRSDGTDAGTTMVKDIRSGTGHGDPAGMTVLGGFLYFSADDGTAGTELWRSDGTGIGTALFTDIEAGAAGSDPQSFTRAGTHLFFTATTSTDGRELWATDGVTTTQLADINPGGDSDPVDLVEMGGQLYFFADDGVNRGLWTSDGTPSGTMLVTLSNGSGLVHNSSALFFVSSDGGNGSEPWTSDGTALGTVLLEDVNGGPSSSNPAGLTVVGERLFFIATDPTNGRELWSSDGITTALVADISPGGASSSLASLGGAGGRFYFSSAGSALWSSDGTLGGTSKVDDFMQLGPVVDAGGVAVFSATGVAGGREPWRSTGAKRDSWMITEIAAVVGSDPTGFTAVGQKVFFAADKFPYGNELWVVALSDLLGCGEMETVCDAAGAGGARLLLKDNADDSRDRFRLVLNSPFIGNFGDPARTTYEVCVYDRTAGVPQLTMNVVVPAIGNYCDGSACWRRPYLVEKFTDATLSRSGIRTLKIDTHHNRTRITVVGKGAGLPMPAPAMSSLLHQDPATTVQVKATSGGCMQADFSAPARKNILSLFRDISD